MELLGREEREGWESVRSGGSTARDITERAVIVIFGIGVLINLIIIGLTNIPRLKNLIGHVAKEEKVKVNYTTINY